MTINFKRASHATMLLLWFSVARMGTGIFLKSSMAHFFGVDRIADAYFAALTVPQQLGDYLIGGILFLVLVPVYQSHRSLSPENEFERDIAGIVFMSFLLLSTLTSLYLVFIEDFVSLAFSGFTAVAKAETIALCRSMSPLILLLGMSLVFTAFCHAHRDFLYPALAMLLFPAFSLAGLWILPQSWGIQRLVAGNLAGAACKLLFLIIRSTRYMRFRVPALRLNPALREALLLSWPVLLCLLVGRLIPLVQKKVASELELEGAVALVEYAFFLSQFVLVLVFQPVSTAIFPLVSEQFSKNERMLAAETFIQAFRVILFLTVPFCILIILQARWLIGLLYEYGRFAYDGKLSDCAILLAAFTLIMIPLSIEKLSAKMFYSMRKTGLFSFVTSLVYVFSIPFYFIFTRLYGLVGIPLAFGLMIMLCALANILVLKRCLSEIKLLKLLRSASVTFLAVFPMSVLAALCVLKLPESVPLTFRILITTFSGFAVYLLTSWIFSGADLKFVLERVRRKVPEGLAEEEEERVIP